MTISKEMPGKVNLTERIRAGIAQLFEAVRTWKKENIPAMMADGFMGLADEEVFESIKAHELSQELFPLE